MFSRIKSSVTATAFCCAAEPASLANFPIDTSELNEIFAPAHLGDTPIDTDQLDAILTDEVIKEAQAKALQAELDASVQMLNELADKNSQETKQAKQDQLDQAKLVKDIEETLCQPTVQPEEGDTSEESRSEEPVSKQKPQYTNSSSSKRSSKVLGSAIEQSNKKQNSSNELENEFVGQVVALPVTAKKPNFFATHPNVKWALIGLGIGLAITAFVAASVFTFGGVAVTAAALAIVLGGCLGATAILSGGLGALVPSMLEDKRQADEIRATNNNNFGPVATPKANKCCGRKPRRDGRMFGPFGPGVESAVPADDAELRKSLGNPGL